MSPSLQILKDHLCGEEGPWLWACLRSILPDLTQVGFRVQGFEFMATNSCTISRGRSSHCPAKKQEKPRSQKAQKPRSKQAAKPRSRKAEKPEKPRSWRNQEAGKPRSQHQKTYLLNKQYLTICSSNRTD